jgi:hypothetical protein
MCLLPACGYSMQRPFPEDVKTVYVEMAQSREFRRELEFMLTEALVKRIQMDTPYRIADRDRADTVFSCEILEVQSRGLADDQETDQPREVASNIIVRYRWKDLRSGKMLVERPRFVYTSSYIPLVGESFNKGMIRGMDGLAEQMVESMENPW